MLDRETRRIIGTSRFRILDPTEKVVEIGWSFLARDCWGGIYNREMKKLMINHALKSCKIIVFYVNPKNFRSLHALRKLGANEMIDRTKPWVLPREKGITFAIDTGLE